MDWTEKKKKTNLWRRFCRSFGSRFSIKDAFTGWNRLICTILVLACSLPVSSRKRIWSEKCRTRVSGIRRTRNRIKMWPIFAWIEAIIIWPQNHWRRNSVTFCGIINRKVMIPIRKYLIRRIFWQKVRCMHTFESFSWFRNWRKRNWDWFALNNFRCISVDTVARVVDGTCCVDLWKNEFPGMF